MPDFKYSSGNGALNFVHSRNILYERSLRDVACKQYRGSRNTIDWRIYCKLRKKVKYVMRRKKIKRMLSSAEMLILLILFRKKSTLKGRSDNSIEVDVNALNEFSCKIN